MAHSFFGPDHISALTLTNKGGRLRLHKVRKERYFTIGNAVFQWGASTSDKGLRSSKLEDVGYVYIGICRVQDAWGNWHEDDFVCTIETKDGRNIDVVRDLVTEAFGLEYTYCGMTNRGSECPEETEDMSKCPYRDEERICRPHLFRFKILIEAMPLEERYPYHEEELEPVSRESIVKEITEKQSETRPAEKIVARSSTLNPADLTETLSNLVLGLKQVTCRSFRSYICFYKGKRDLNSIFAVLLRSKAGLTVRIRTDPNTFKDAQAWTSNVSKKWFFTNGQGDETEFMISDESQIEHALKLIEQAHQTTNI